MAWDGSHFYIGDYSGTNNVYEYSLGGTLLNTIPLSKCSSYCDGLEYAHGDLISNEYDGGDGGNNTYDVYSTSNTLLQAGFITGHTTGVYGPTAGAVDLGDDASRLRWARLCGLADDQGESHRRGLTGSPLASGGSPTGGPFFCVSRIAQVERLFE